MHDLRLVYGFLLKVFDQARSHTGSVAGKQPQAAAKLVPGDGRAVELQLDVAVEIDPYGVILTVTHWGPLSFR